MHIHVLFFGTLKDVTGRATDSVTLPEKATVTDLLAHYAAQFPRMQQYANALAVAVNQEYAARDAALHDNDEVGLLPPVSGGTESSGGPHKPAVGLSGEVNEPLVRIVRERIRPHDIIPPLERPEDGAIVIFDGIVRNHSRGRPTLYLEYEAYEPMALKQMRYLVREAMGLFPIRNVALVHRVGHLEIGESSVLIAVFSAHRAPAFDACRWLIDTLKKTVPIWKKEFFEDGAVWAEGEPFPPEIVRNLAADPEFKHD